MKVRDLLESLQDREEYYIAIYDKSLKDSDYYELLYDKEAIAGWNPDGSYDYEDIKKYYESDVCAFRASTPDETDCCIIIFIFI